MHAVARLRDARLARSSKPFAARGGSRQPHCPGCRLIPSHCICAQRRQLHTRTGVCLLMHDIEPLKPSNTGWLVADVVADTFAFGWARTSADPALLALLADPQWQPCVVFPQEYADAARVVDGGWLEPRAAGPAEAAAPRPLLVLLDGTWSQARKMFHKSPYLDRLPVLGLQGALSHYLLRRARQPGHLCTAEVAALCLQLAGDGAAAAQLDGWLQRYSRRYWQAKEQRPACDDDLPVPPPGDPT
ncbi:tRNA-uridine aminocarboxypropyltransferase [Comamonas faecalis]|uniref:tRNA-uridine aminocarboxypropyltransferase n=1 Tax=Comamonas faecalis TaxID=1387849 RepID=A0ABP7QR77_9BURK